MSTEFIVSLFYIDALSLIMMGLVGFVAVSVGAFASRYLKGDSQYRNFFILLVCMAASVFVMVSANNIALFLGAWLASNALLVRLMVYKSNWQAAKQSGILAAKTFGLGFISLAAGLGLLAVSSGQATIQGLLSAQYEPPILGAALALIMIATMTQSALWPFHKWLTSSLNSPTPVSAIMHAGLVNGGGFLLAKFAVLYISMPAMLTVIFTLGLLTAILGTLWKLMQSDIKRMLGCSTMGQMGFMIAQCGMGLFPAAIAHLCWHGLFKAYLFLASGGAAQEKRLDLHYPPSTKVFALSIICGLIGAYGFTLASGKVFFANDTTLILIAIAFIAGTQFAMPILRNSTFKMLPIAAIATGTMGTLYGFSVHGFEALLAPQNMMQPQPLNVVHIAGMITLAGAWLAMLFARNPEGKGEYPQWVLKAYVWMLNASLPHPKTITAHKNQYQY